MFNPSSLIVSPSLTLRLSAKESRGEVIIIVATIAERADLKRIIDADYFIDALIYLKFSIIEVDYFWIIKMVDMPILTDATIGNI
jgi:hypothetical protein